VQTDTWRRKLTGKYGEKEDGDVDISDLSVSALCSNVSEFDSGYSVVVDFLSRYRKMPGAVRSKSVAVHHWRVILASVRYSTMTTFSDGSFIPFLR
jgi:hypothetical protein